MTIRWEASALAELTDAWLAAGSQDRRLISAAAAQIDRLLQYDPDRQGESRAEGRRVLIAPPLGALPSR